MYNLDHLILTKQYFVKYACNYGRSIKIFRGSFYKMLVIALGQLRSYKFVKHFAEYLRTVYVQKHN